MKTLRYKYVLDTDPNDFQTCDYDDATEKETHEAANPQLLEGRTAVDDTPALLKEQLMALRERQMVACREAIKLIGLINFTKEAGIQLTISATPAMQQIGFLLLTGAPATAKSLIQGLATELYTPEEKQQIYDLLDPVIQ